MARRKSDREQAGRRAFLKLGGAAAAGLIGRSASAQTPVANPAPAMPIRNLGRTGYKAGIFSLGGQAALEHANNDDIAVPIIERALDLGVNYFDTSSIYGGPERWSEQYYRSGDKAPPRAGFPRQQDQRAHARWLPAHAGNVAEAAEDRSSGPLATARYRDSRRCGPIFGKGGAMEALLQAREQKMVRYLGVTGHFRPEPLMAAIRRHPFDTILMALNAADGHHFSFMEALLPLAVEKQMGIIGMKVPGRSRLLANWTPPSLERQQHSWEGAVIANRPGTLTMREAMILRTRSR